MLEIFNLKSYNNSNKKYFKIAHSNLEQQLTCYGAFAFMHAIEIHVDVHSLC